MGFLRRFHVWFALVFFCVLTAVVFWPLLRAPFTTVFDDYDGVFIPWTINWVAYALSHTPLKLFDAPIFSPYPLTLTFSDPMFTGALLAAPFLWLTKEPLVASTVNILFAAVATAWFTYLAAHEMTKNKGVSVLAGVFASFSVTHLHYLGHLHTFMVQFIPLGLYAWLRYAKTRALRWTLVLAGSFLAQVLNSPFSGYLFIGALMGMVGWRGGRASRPIIVVALSTLAIAFLVLSPFFISASRYHSARTIRDAAHFSLSPLELFDPHRVSILFSVMFAITVLRWKKLSKPARGFFVSACVGLILALGPVLKWDGKTVKIPFPIPLPYTVAYYILPGFRAFRTPSRWLVLSHFMLVFAAALQLKKAKGRVLIGLAVVVATVIGWEVGPFLQTVSVPARATRPAVYRWLEASSFRSVAHVPPYIYDMGEKGKFEAWRMLFSLPEHRVYALFNGYSGFAPRERIDDMITIFREFPSETSLFMLQEAKVEAVVVHIDELSPEQVEGVRGLKLPVVYQDETTRVLSL